MSLLPNLGSIGSGVSNFYNGVATTSLRLNDDDDAYLSRTPAGATNRKTWTYSTWFKIANTSASQTLFSAGSAATGRVALYMSGGQFITDLGGTGTYDQSTALFRDPSAWYHLVWAFDTTQGTGANRSRIYINGTEITLTKTRTWSSNTNYAVNNNTLHVIGGFANAPVAFSSDAYHAETNFVDGSQLTPSSFGETKNGVWIPIEYTGSYGTNGFRLQFASTTHDAPASEGNAETDNIGADSSGENNHWTASDSIDTEDCAMPDSPENNFATLNPLALGADGTLSEGNLKIIYGSSVTRTTTTATMGIASGKWYWEVNANHDGAEIIGITNISDYAGTYPGSASGSWGYYSDDGQKYVEGTASSYGASYTTGDIIGFALDMDAGTLVAYKNNSSQGTLASSLTGDIYPAIGDGAGTGTTNNVFNFGQDASFAGAITAGTETDGTGAVFKYAPPSGYLALCTANLPEPTIGANSLTQADDHFNTALYTGNGGTIDITVGFQPDFSWYKCRAGGTNRWHYLFDSNRGANKALYGNDTYTEDSQTPTFNTQSFQSNGTRIVRDNGDHLNFDGDTYVSWNWKANGGTATASGSESGNNPAYSVQANPTAGFSIVTYTGTGATGTVPHGLGVVPQMMIFKNRGSAGNWATYHGSNTAAPATDVVYLNLSNATADTVNMFNDTAPTSSVFTVDTNGNLNEDGVAHVAYIFAEVEGYSKMGSFTGNGSTDGTFCFTNFAVKWLMVKRTDTADNWAIYDSTRDTFNVRDSYLYADLNQLETTYSTAIVDFLSNGFKWRGAVNFGNASGGTYIYMAFAESPFKYANAR